MVLSIGTGTQSFAEGRTNVFVKSHPSTSNDERISPYSLSGERRVSRAQDTTRSNAEMNGYTRPYSVT